MKLTFVGAAQEVTGSCHEVEAAGHRGEVAGRAALDAPVHVLPMAALTKGREGREMTEIGFLQDAGAVAFSDGFRVIENTKIYARALTESEIRMPGRRSAKGLVLDVALTQAERARAFLDGRGYVTPKDVKRVAMDVFRHRVITTYEAEAEGLSSEQVVQTVLDTVPVP